MMRSALMTFTIPGKPFGKQRHRTTRTGRTYTPKETVAFENVVRSYALEHFAAPIEGAVKVTVFASFETAASWSKKKTSAYLGRYHLQKPDSDNIAKAIKDGLNRIAYTDDSQVAWLDVRKIWGPESKTVITVEALEAWS